LARMVISSSPALIVSGAMRRTIAGPRSVRMSSTGRTYSATRLLSSRRLPRRACARRMPSRHAARVPPRGRARGKAVETPRQGALDFRDPEHLAGLVQLGGHIADLGQCDEP